MNNNKKMPKKNHLNDDPAPLQATTSFVKGTKFYGSYAKKQNKPAKKK